MGKEGVQLVRYTVAKIGGKTELCAIEHSVSVDEPVAVGRCEGAQDHPCRSSRASIAFSRSSTSSR